MLNVKRCDSCGKVSVKHGEKWSAMQEDKVDEWSRKYPIVVNNFVCPTCEHNAKTLTQMAGQTC